MQQLDATAEQFYAEALDALTETGVPFLVGGAYALRQYADIARDTKDLDIFCKASDYPRLLLALSTAGYDTELTDPVWLAKARSGPYLIDLIFGSANGLCPVDNSWLEHAPTCELLGHQIRLLPAEELIWSKSYVQDRNRYDGADIQHVIRKSGPSLDWNRLLMRMEPHWEVLLAHLSLFRFVYPSERDIVPDWLLEELLGRVQQQLTVPPAKEKICRGPLLSKIQYQIDIEQWGYREK